MSPAEGPITGGTIVTLRGTSLDGAAVTLDRAPVTPLSQSGAEIRLQMPARDNGFAVIAVANAAGAAYGEFLYVPPRLEDLPAGFITTVAGVGHFSGDYRTATSAIVSPWGVAFDGAGNTYIAEAFKDRVVRVRADGVLEPFAGNGRIFGPRPAGPTPALDVPISYPRGIAVDSAGNVLIPDTTYNLWRVSPDGTAQIIAGTGREEFSGDGGPAIAAAIGHPSHIAVDGQDNVYFLDYTNARIRKIDRSGIISTVAGTGTYGFSGDGGPATAAQYDIPFPDHGGLVSDDAGNLFLLDYSNRRIRRIDAATGVITTLIDAEMAGSFLNDMRGIALDRSGNLYFSNAAEILLRSPDGTITRLTTGRGGFSPDGTPLQEARIGGSILAVTSAGELVISEVGRVRRVDGAGRLQTIAGSGPGRVDEGNRAVTAVLTTPNTDVDVLPSGEIVFGDDDRIRKVSHEGFVTTIAGTGTAGPLEGVPAAAASVAAASIAVASDGSIDYVGGSVFTIGSDGIVRRAAGHFAPCAFAGDGGNALDATLCQPWDAGRDRDGNLLVADTNNNRIRRVDRLTGVITTIAGSGPSNGLERYGAGRTCGDGGPATSACINTPYGVVADDAGNVYVSEVDTNGRIRRIDPSGTISTFAETTATKLTLFRNHLYAVSVDHVVRLAPDGGSTVIAGTTGQFGFSGDGGLATAATMLAQKQSHGVAIDAAGNLFFSDGDNRRIRAVRYGAVLAPPGAMIGTTANGSRLTATVRDEGGRPLAAVRVEFSAPSAGASCRFAEGRLSIGVITDEAGVASATCVPNCTAGSFVVTAQPAGASVRDEVTVTNVAGACRRRAVRR